MANHNGLTRLLGVLVLAGCGSTVSVGTGGAGSTSPTSTGAGTGAGGADSMTYPLVAQTLDTGTVRLLISNLPLDCGLPNDYVPTSLYACDSFLVTATVPANAFTTGAILQDGVGGVRIFGAESAPGTTNCPSGAGPWSSSFQIELLDVSASSVSARITGAKPFFYQGMVNGDYQGAACGAAPDPLPNPGRGNARFWSGSTTHIVVTSQSLDCTPNPPAPTACESWQVDLMVPSAQLVVGPLDPSANVTFSGNGKLHPMPQSPTDCAKGTGSFGGQITIDSVSGTEVGLTLDHFDDGVTANGVDGVYTATACP